MIRAGVWSGMWEVRLDREVRGLEGHVDSVNPWASVR